MESSRLAAVFVDLAYARRSTVVQAGEGVFRDATALHGRSFGRARDWLVERGFVQPLTPGKSHVAASWQLMMPGESSPAEERVNAEPASPAQERVKRDAPSPATTPAASPAPSPASSPAQGRALLEPVLRENQNRGVREFVDAWVAWKSEQGVIVPSQLSGHAARVVAQLIDDGIEFAIIVAALKLMHERGKDSPSLLPSFVAEVQNPGRRAGHEHPAEAYARKHGVVTSTWFCSDENGAR